MSFYFNMALDTNREQFNNLVQAVFTLDFLFNREYMLFLRGGPIAVAYPPLRLIAVSPSKHSPELTKDVIIDVAKRF